MNKSEPLAPGVPPAGQGTPYHLQQRTPGYRWWRTLLGLVVVAGLSMAFIVVMYGVLAGIGALFGVPQDENGFADPLWEFTAMHLGLAALLPAVFLTVRWVHRQPVGTLSSVRGRLRWRWMMRCVAWALLGFVVLSVVSLIGGAEWDGDAWPGRARFVSIIAISVFVVPLQSAAEEYLCRGFLLQSFASWFRSPWPAAVLTALVFVGMHEYQDLLALVDLVVFALAISWLTIRTDGIEAAVALHVVNNLTATVLTAPQGVSSLDQSEDYTVWDVLPGTLLILFYAWWIARCYRNGDRTGTCGRTHSKTPEQNDVGAGSKASSQCAEHVECADHHVGVKCTAAPENRDAGGR